MAMSSWPSVQRWIATASDIDFVIGSVLVSRRRQRAVHTLLEQALHHGQGLLCSSTAHDEHLYSLNFLPQV